MHLTICKNNPLFEKQTREIRSKEVNRYFKKKDHQKIKIEANTISDGSNTLTQLDGFEKQLEEYKYHI